MLGVFVLYGASTLVSNVFMPLVYRKIIDTVSYAGDRWDMREDLSQTFFWLVAVVITYQILYRSGDYAIVYTQSNVMKKIADRTFEGLRSHSYHFFSSNFTGSIIAKAKRYIRSFEDIYDQTVFAIWMTIVKIVGVFITLLFLAPQIGFGFFVWTVVYVWFALWLAKKKVPYDEASAEQDSKVVARLSDAVSNMLAVKTFSAGKREQRSFERATKREEYLRRKSWNFQNHIFLLQTTLLSILEIGGIYVAVQMWLDGKISAGTVALVQMYIVIIFDALLFVGRTFSKMAGNLAYAVEMVDILESTPDVIDPEKPETPRMNKGKISFESVGFRYENGESVFHNFSLEIAAGEKVGLVGPSGAGKSTVTKLLLRFMDPQEGVIRVDGQDIRAITQDDLRKVVSYVPQDALLFHRSVESNVSYGNTGASRYEVEQAAKKAQAHDFIMRLPDTYETLVGERGVKLSGGERQRVAIARAILKNAPILILDEATSALDSESEQYIQKAFEELMVGKTAIVIAHRLSTIRKLDRVVVLNREGAIEEQGTHDELISKGGLYANLWNRQTGMMEVGP